MKIKNCLLLALFLGFIAYNNNNNPQIGETIEGKVVTVLSGDTYELQ